MATFPSLSSGAVTQYPTTITSGRGVQVIRFLDGSDQRYLSRGKALRQWKIRFDQLNETETAALEAFFVAQQGDFSSFIFPDPISGTNVPNCRFAASGLMSEYAGIDTSSAELVVVETNG